MAGGDTTTRWTQADVRAWVQRHGGNVTACARRLDVRRSSLNDWLSPAGRSPVPRSVQRHMEDLDRLARYEPVLRARGGRG